MTKTKQNKEWKGNRSSVSVMTGMSTVWNPEQRAAGDFYTTDPEAVKTFLQRMSRLWAEHKDFKYWEPACGSGNISKVLEEFGYGHEVISTDLYDRGYGTSGVDFLQSELPEGVRVIITNPPYSLADEFVRHAMDILPWDGVYVALQNINYLAGKGRFRDIYSEGFLKDVYIHSGRISCYKNGEPSGHSSPVNYGWFVYSNNHTRFCNEAGFDWEEYYKKDAKLRAYEGHPSTDSLFDTCIYWI